MVHQYQLDQCKSRRESCLFQRSLELVLNPPNFFGNKSIDQGNYRHCRSLPHTGRVEKWGSDLCSSKSGAFVPLEEGRSCSDGAGLVLKKQGWQTMLQTEPSMSLHSQLSMFNSSCKALQTLIVRNNERSGQRAVTTISRATTRRANPSFMCTSRRAVIFLEFRWEPFLNFFLCHRPFQIPPFSIRRASTRVPFQFLFTRVVIVPTKKFIGFPIPTPRGLFANPSTANQNHVPLFV